MPDNGMSTVPPAADWTPQERFVWERVTAGEVADFNTADGYGGNLDPKKPEGWPENRVLRSTFLETILLKEPYRRNLTRRGVIIVGARFTEAIELDNAELEHLLVLFRNLIERGAYLSGLRSKYPINLSGSKIVGTLQTNGLDIDADVLMRDGEFAEVDLTSARIGGALSFISSTVAGKLNMNSLRVGRSLLMYRAELAEVDLTSARIGGQLALDDSKVAGELRMNGLQVEQDLFMSHKAEFTEVDLTSARIGGALSFISSMVTGMLNMNGLRVEQSLFMHDKAEFTNVELTAAQIGGQLNLIDSQVYGFLNCNSANVGGTVLLSRGATFLGPINLNFTKIGQNLELAGGIFGNQVDMTGARIGGEFRLGSRHWPTTWRADAALILRNASVDTIQDLSDAWPARLELNGFDYQSLGDSYTTEGDSMLERPLRWFEAWLGKQERYTPQPYEQLASCLKNNYGKGEMATAIRHAGAERERKESSGPWLYLWLTIFKYSVDYGYRPSRALGWAAAFVLLGAAVLHISGEGLRNNMPYGIAYSFDMLLPIVKLQESHYKIDLMGWARYYFFVQKIMGYLIASVLIASLKGKLGPAELSEN